MFRALAPRLLAYFRVRGCGVELSQDLVQEVLLSVYRNAGKLRGKELFWAWLYRVAANAHRRYLRDVSRRPNTVPCGRELESLQDEADDPLLHSQFVEWMAWLNPEERQVMMLRYVDELEYHEIAAALDLPTGTVQWRVFHAKRKLAARFGAGRTSR